jgi:heme-degrading monooxygenase HmoA
MIFEVALINIRLGSEEDFEAGVAEALPIFRRAKGCRSLRLERSIESPLRYRLVIGWDSLEDHVVGFRNSDGFQAWRLLVGHTFSAPPQVDHNAIVLTGFECAPASLSDGSSSDTERPGDEHLTGR